MAYIIQLHNIGKFDIMDDQMVGFQKVNSVCDFVETNYYQLEHITCYQQQSFLFEIECLDTGHGFLLIDNHDAKFTITSSHDELEMMKRIRSLLEIGDANGSQKI